MIILVTGSRYANMDVHGPIIRRTLAWATGMLISPDGTIGPVGLPHELWDGSAEGVDVIARRIAREDFGWDWRPFAANWPACDPQWRDPVGNVQRCTAGHRARRKSGVEYCPTAGFRRNQLMVDQLLLRAEERRVCLAFPIPDRGSRGTEDCLTRAYLAKVVTIVVPLHPTP